MIKTFCDRCGKEIKRPCIRGFGIETHWAKVAFWLSCEDPRPTKYDVTLCDDCYMDLVDWMKGKEG